ncbi:MAG: hypothetical protein HYX44_06400 [Aquabacterium sp.]|nr:hypothetical protein [Aquabacterium sp.]
MPSTGLTVIWFLGIVALIPLTLWALKRSGLATGTVGAAQALIKPVSQRAGRDRSKHPHPAHDGAAGRTRW